jgi:hypothetical protein
MKMISKFQDFEVDVFALLGMRNLSAFLGEAFGAMLAKSAAPLFVSNPHQNGYPDLLLLDEIGKAHWDSLSGRRREKQPFSPFSYGGLEVKATCGTVPTAKQMSKKGLQKPGIGDSRAALLRGYDWKAHHRESNHLMGLLWDFVDGAPTIAAVFYSSNLTEDSWGNIVQPKAGGGRTTSVSIMNRGGIKEMYSGWVLCLDSPHYVQFLNKYNKSNLIA